MSSRGKRICKKACATAALFVLIASFFFYLRYLDLKETLLDSLSAKATLVVGQRVEIGDLSLSPSTLDISRIRIGNPAGFAAGDLVRIRRVSVGLDLAALLKGKLHIRDIEVYYPELSIAKDREGRWNISEKLIRLLSEKKKPAFRYEIDEVRIRSGTFMFTGDRWLKNEHIDARLTGLSSQEGTKTIINGSTVLAGNKINIAARAHLTDEPKKFMLIITATAFSLSGFRDMLERYGVDTKKTKLDFSFTAEGDTGRGFRIRSDITARKAAFSFVDDDSQDIRLMADAFLSTKDSRLTVNSASLNAGKGTSIGLRGEVDISKTPRYRAKILVKKTDLSALRFFKGIRMKGFVTSSGINLRGKAGEGLPEIAGSAVLNDLSVKSSDVEVDRMNGELTFSPARGFSVQARTTADIAKAGPFLPAKPARLRLTLSASKERGGISFSSSATISSFETDTGEKQKIRTGSTSLNAAGSLTGKKLSCKGTIEVKDLSYAGHSVPLLRASSSIDADGHRSLVKDLKITGRGLTAVAVLIQLMPDRTGERYQIKITGLDAAYPEEKAAINGLDLSLALRRKKTLSGDIALSAGKVFFKGIETGRIKAKGGFDGRDFHFEIPDADVFRGKMHIAAKGKISGDHFPLSITASADNFDLEALSTAASSFVQSHYMFVGRLAHASFEGTIVSPEDVRGHASLSASGVSAAGKAPKKNIVKDVSVDAATTFAGRDLSLGLYMSAGSVSAKASAEVKRFADKQRTFALKVDLPEVKAAAVRDSFWDIFPDSLLYTGLAGSLSSHFEITGGKGVLRANGDLTLKDLTLTGENDEYSLGPVNGGIPIGYARPAVEEQADSLPSFDRSDFEKLKRIYSQKGGGHGFNMITIGSIRYGFRLLEDISLLVKQKDGVFTIDSFSANIFGGKLNGSAVITASDGLGYRGGAMIEGLSLKRVCDDIEPIKGYISGKIDGVMTIKGSGLGLSGLIGKGDFWTYSGGGEKTKISRKFLRTIAGPSLKGYVGDRSFDRGVMSFYLQNGFLIFKQLEISNRNFFGMTDLSVKVAPYNNRIDIDRLMWSITEAAQRAKKE